MENCSELEFYRFRMVETLILFPVNSKTREEIIWVLADRSWHMLQWSFTLHSYHLKFWNRHYISHCKPELAVSLTYNTMLISDSLSYMSNNAIQNFHQTHTLVSPYESPHMVEHFLFCNAITVDSYPHHPILQAHPDYISDTLQSSYPVNAAPQNTIPLHSFRSLCRSGCKTS